MTRSGCRVSATGIRPSDRRHQDRSLRADALPAWYDPSRSTSLVGEPSVVFRVTIPVEFTTRTAQTTMEETEHPGALLRVYVLPALRLSVSQAARDLEITRQTLHRILAGAAALTPEMAVRLERLCGVASEFWLDRQHRHELQRVRRENAAVLTRIPCRSLPKDVIKQIGASDGR
jgi:antitoxin HigA-1